MKQNTQQKWASHVEVYQIEDMPWLVNIYSSDKVRGFRDYYGVAFHKVSL